MSAARTAYPASARHFGTLWEVIKTRLDVSGGVLNLVCALGMLRTVFGEAPYFRFLFVAFHNPV